MSRLVTHSELNRTYPVAFQQVASGSRLVAVDRGEQAFFHNPGSPSASDEPGPPVQDL